MASNDTFALPEDEQCFTADVLANDLDIDGDALNVVLMSSGVPGQLWMLSGGYFQYIPPPNYVGQMGTDSAWQRLSELWARSCGWFRIDCCVAGMLC